MTRLHPRGGAVAVSSSGGTVSLSCCRGPQLWGCADHCTAPQCTPAIPAPHPVQAAAATEEKLQCQ